MVMFRIVLTVICFIGLNVLVSAQVAVQYAISFPEPWTHYAQVELRLSGLKKDFTTVEMAAWTPGSYMIRDYAGLVESVEAFSTDGQEIKIQKTAKDRWQIQHGKSTVVVLRYQVYCSELSPRSSYIDREHAALVPAALILYPVSYTGPFELVIKPFKEWTTISTALAANSQDPWILLAKNLDELLDSPIEIGTHKPLKIQAGGVDHDFVMQGPGNYDTSQVKSDVAAIINECTELFGHNPNTEFLFILNNTDNSYGGLEHLASTNMIYRRWGYAPPSTYEVFLGLISHEYLHVWNGKRIRPIELSQFDYGQEMFTRSLWIVEGFTSYYDDLILRRAGLITEASYLAVAESNLNTALNRPGDAVQSVAESSFDAWIKYYKGNENSSNSTVSYYNKGSVIAMALDLDILASTAGFKRLDDVMRELYPRYREHPEVGYSEAEFKAIVEEIIGRDMTDFFDRYVYGTAPMDFKPYFERIGVTLSDPGMDYPSLVFGASVDQSNKITRVVRDQPASKGCLQAGDEILSVSGYRFSGDLKVELGRIRDGESMEILVSRDKRILSMTVRPEKIGRHDFRLSIASNATEQQLQLYRKWLNMDQ